MRETENSLENLEPADFDYVAFDRSESEPPPIRWPSRNRMLTVLAVLLAVLLLILLPPLINVNRYRKQIASSISLSLGRPVRIDSVALTMLPAPGFTLQTFIVGEDPAFGAEPVLRADSVRVSLRASSLWRGHVEFSKIVLTDPSVNLVHLPDGRWNLESILLQASRMPAAPTAQKARGDAPRFPYIEATGARVNLKMGPQKMPLSLTDARFALWLPQPQQWRLRLEAHPNRTDGPPMDTGLLRAEGTLGKASTLDLVPVDLQATWLNAPLGAVSSVLMGHDGDLRGDLTLDTRVKGTVGNNTVDAHLDLHRLRRSDFVPEHMLDVDLRCDAQATNLFHRLSGMHCSWPADSPGNGLQLSGEFPEALQVQTLSGTATLKEVPAAALLDALHVVSRGTSADLTATGVLSGSLKLDAGVADGQVTVAGADIQMGGQPLTKGDLRGLLAGKSFTVAPVPVALGGAEPASLTATITPNGYQLHLTGTVLRSRLLVFAKALPECGEGLEAIFPPVPESSAPASETPPVAAEQPIFFDLVSNRVWGRPQVWSPATAIQTTAPRGGRKSRRRR